MRKATEIIWDVDDGEELDSIPSEVEIPDEIGEDEVSDYLSDVTGYCHKCFVLEEDE